MLFNSVSYAVFLPVSVIGYYLTNFRYRNIFLLAASYYFYMCWMPQYAVLIGFSTAVTWGAGFFIDKSESSVKRKMALGLNIIINIGILFIFKYYNFFTDILELLLYKNNIMPRIWGLLHGLYRIIEEVLARYFRPIQSNKTVKMRMMPNIKTLFTFFLVMIAWTFFRAETIGQSLWIVRHYFQNINWLIFKRDFVGVVEGFMPSGYGFVHIYTILTALSICILFYSDWLYQYKAVPIENKLSEIPAVWRWMIYYGLIVSILFAFVMTTNEFGQAGAFLYFQF